MTETTAAWRFDRLSLEAREAAEDAASAAGLPLSLWLARLIAETSAAESATPAPDAKAEPAAAPDTAAPTLFVLRPTPVARLAAKETPLPPAPPVAEEAPPRPGDLLRLGEPIRSRLRLRVATGPSPTEPIADPTAAAAEPSVAPQITIPPDSAATPPAEAEPTTPAAPAAEAPLSAAGPRATATDRRAVAGSDTVESSSPGLPQRSVSSARHGQGMDGGDGHDQDDDESDRSSGPCDSGLTIEPVQSDSHAAKAIAPADAANAPVEAPPAPGAQAPSPPPSLAEPRAEAAPLAGAGGPGEALAALGATLAQSNLSPLDEARAYLRLLTEFSLSATEIAKVTGRDRPYMARCMRLLGLPPRLRQMIEDGRLSRDHALALLDAEEPESLADAIIAEGLSVEETRRRALEAAA